MEVCRETAEFSHRFCISVRRYRHVVFCTSYVNPRRMQIQRWKPYGCICFRSILSLASLLCHIVDLPKVKFDGLDPVANRFYETLQRGRANWPKPAGCHQITDRQKPEPYSETGTCGRHISLGLNCRVASASASHSATVSGTTYSVPLSPARKLFCQLGALPRHMAAGLQCGPEVLNAACAPISSNPVSGLRRTQVLPKSWFRRIAVMPDLAVRSIFPETFSILRRLCIARTEYPKA
jgi:hypothetical protein